MLVRNALLAIARLRNQNALPLYLLQYCSTGRRT
jgi:hypothetical protein